MFSKIRSLSKRNNMHSSQPNLQFENNNKKNGHSRSASSSSGLYNNKKNNNSTRSLGGSGGSNHSNSKKTTLNHDVPGGGQSLDDSFSVNDASTAGSTSYLSANSNLQQHGSSSASNLLLGGGPAPANIIMNIADLEALDFKLIDQINHSYDLIKVVPGDYKQQLGKNILFNMCISEPKTLQLFGLETARTPVDRCNAWATTLGRMVDDMVMVALSSVPGCNWDPLVAALAPRFSRRGFDMTNLFPAFCQAVPTAVRRMLHGDWTAEMGDAWKKFMDWSVAALLGPNVASATSSASASALESSFTRQLEC